ncbi:sialate O-acetylesterase [Hymenobacter swuensis]|uniref:Putative acetyl xylan esterase AxeA n=1 Tax=Hymenobacter swuensis DY53 TaxID=1227739 RepID=W8F763_9BACT|nr:sialate O-acetylesterase [Hymenobacter swuensis]AHJ98426.1 putative acetyl xylan esterase AxeA [Hymenobacter swuensis DY53]
MNHLSLLLLTITTLLTGSAGAQSLRPKARQQVTPPVRKEKFRLYLLVGQSNMAGRGTVETQDTLPNRHVLRLNAAGQWEVAQDPIHFDKSVAGVGPGLTFGRTLAAQDTSVVIGLITCAVGGSAISYWQPGAFYPPTKTNPYDDAIRRARAAMQSGTLAGIIWHQGESDSNPAGSAAYAQNLTALIARFRQDLQAPTVPFVAGQLPEFQLAKPDSAGRPHTNQAAQRINATVAALRKTVSRYAYVTAEGTTHIGDYTHFNATSARLMGRRYAAAMLRLQKASKKSSR